MLLSEHLFHRVYTMYNSFDTLFPTCIMNSVCTLCCTAYTLLNVRLTSNTMLVILQREWIGVSEGRTISLEPVTITRTSSLIGTLSLEVDFNRMPK